MVKNESNNILYSLASCPKAKSFIIYDTGSTDDTITQIKDFCKKNNILLFLKQGHFVDFSTSRNILIKFAMNCKKNIYKKYNMDHQNDDHVLLLLDANDELMNEDKFITFLEKEQYNNSKVEAYYICQEWVSNGSVTTFYNYRCVRDSIRQPNVYFYQGVVHEYISRSEDVNVTTTENTIATNIRINYPVCLYHNRDRDVSNSKDRWLRDLKLLQQDLKKYHLPRTVYYLAQTYMCLGMNELAVKYFKERSDMNDNFYEEKFHAIMNLAHCKSNIKNNKDDEIICLYLDAYNIAQRVEPLIQLTYIYLDKQKYHNAYLFAKLAVSLKYPEDAMLFVSKENYEYTRYHLLGIVAFYVNDLKSGKDACDKAIMARQQQIDINNRKFYI